MAVDVRRLVELGMVPELAKEIANMIDTAAAAYTDADAQNAIATKTEVAALTSGSDAAAIVAALKA